MKKDIIKKVIEELETRMDEIDPSSKEWDVCYTTVQYLEKWAGMQDIDRKKMIYYFQEI